jgi:hypothetical protein
MGQINFDFFEKLMTEKVISNLATPSAFAMDIGHYHGKKVRKSLTKAPLKKDMRRHGIPHKDVMKKFAIFLVSCKGFAPKPKQTTLMHYLHHMAVQ